MNSVQQEIDRLYKQHFGQLVASLLYSSRDIDPETAEDIVQDAFSAALINWEEKGAPFNPMGWIYKVCKNNALNKIQKLKRSQSLTDHSIAESVETRFSESIVDDQTLKLLFACAHPYLAPKIQVVITLKYVANLKVESIARSLAMTVDGVDKLLLRARQRIKDEKILFSEPDPIWLNARLASVHKVLYLVFNEGYKSSWGAEILQEELCEEALFMTKALVESRVGTKDTAALYALMLYNSARFKSRFNAAGELVDLENQDRSLWNTELIALGDYYLQNAQQHHVSNYHIEASIACLHCQARNFHTTDWVTISKLYGKLAALQSNPFVDLNHAIASYFAGFKKEAFAILHRLEKQTFLGQYFLLNSSLGKLYHLENDHQTARVYLTKAHQQATIQKEKDFIAKVIGQLNN